MDTAPYESVGTRLGELIEANLAEIERRWLERVERDIVGGKLSIEPTHLRDGLPDYLSAIAAEFKRSGAGQGPDSRVEPSWTTVAREHGITRVRIGFDIHQLIHEFIILRQTIRQVAAEQRLVAAGAEALLADALDAAIEASVGAYVSARDYAARQKEAENVAFLTHELRNPLSTAMISAARLRGNAAPGQMAHLDALDRSHQRLNAMIDRVLLTQKVVGSKVESRQVDTTLEQIIAPATEAARAEATRKGVEFHTQYDPALLVRVDPQLTRSAIQNLADNAAKYADVGHIDLAVEDRVSELIVHVRDTCEGLSEAELRTIFEPFERGTTGKSGTGLGLAIAKRAVEAQGGSIHAESSGQSGCHFWIELPKSQSADVSTRTAYK